MKSQSRIEHDQDGGLDQCKLVCEREGQTVTLIFTEETARITGTKLIEVADVMARNKAIEEKSA